MNKLLYVTKALPNPKSAEAGSKISFNHLEHFASQYDVSLISFTNGPEDAANAAQFPLKLHEVVTVPASLSRKLLNVLRSPHKPILTSVRYDPSFRELLKQVLREWQPDVVLADFTQMARYVEVIRAGAPRAVTILYEHDVSTQMARRRSVHAQGLARLFWSREASLLEREEPRLCNQFDLVCAPTQKDIELLAGMGVERSRLLRVIGFLLRNNDAGEWQDPGEGPPTLLYVGALSRFENAEAVRRLVRKILPALRIEFPDLTVKVVGGGEAALASELKGVPGVIFTGFVSSILEVARQCHLAVFPLTLGAGVKVKVLEAMAWGTPVVTTSVGAEGIGATDGTHMEIADDDAALIGRVDQLLRDPVQRSRLGRAGQELCLREFESTQQMARLQARVEKLLREKR